MRLFSLIYVYDYDALNDNAIVVRGRIQYVVIAPLQRAPSISVFVSLLFFNMITIVSI